MNERQTVMNVLAHVDAIYQPSQNDLGTTLPRLSPCKLYMSSTTQRGQRSDASKITSFAIIVLLVHERTSYALYNSSIMPCSADSTRHQGHTIIGSNLETTVEGASAEKLKTEQPTSSSSSPN